MKKLLLLILALSMAFVMVSCDEEYVEDYKTEDYAQESTDDETADEEMGAEGDMTVSDYINENYDDMVAQIGDLSNEGMTFDVYERDNSLIYDFTFTEALSNVDGTKVMIEDTIDSNAGIYSAIYENLISYVPSAATLSVEYYTVDNELITAREFSTGGGTETQTEGDMPTYSSVTEFIEANPALFELAEDSPQREFVSLEAYEAEGSLVYAFSYLIELTDPQAEKEYVDNNTENDDYYMEMYTMLKEFIPSLNSVVLEYYTVDGEFFTAKEYK